MSQKTKIRWGIGVPQVFINEPIDLALINQFAVKAEQLGYDSLWTLDIPPRAFAWLEPVTLLTYLAPITTRVRLGTAILIITTRNPLQLAKSLATLDRLSNGRFVLGAGSGGAGMDMTRYGLPSDRIVGRFMEGIEIMKALWTQPAVTYRGDFNTMNDFTVEPKPVQSPHIPIWFGGGHPNALKRAIKHADGWMGAGSGTAPGFGESVKLVRQGLQEAGRDRSTFTISKRVYIAVDDDVARATRRMEAWMNSVYFVPALAKNAVIGSRAACAEKLAQFAAAGAELLLVHPVVDYLDQAEELRRVIEMVEKG